MRVMSRFATSPPNQHCTVGIRFWITRIDRATYQRCPKSLPLLNRHIGRRMVLDGLTAWGTKSALKTPILWGLIWPWCRTSNSLKLTQFVPQIIFYRSVLWFFKLKQSNDFYGTWFHAEIKSRALINLVGNKRPHNCCLSIEVGYFSR